VFPERPQAENEYQIFRELQRAPPRESADVSINQQGRLHAGCSTDIAMAKRFHCDAFQRAQPVLPCRTAALYTLSA